MTGDTSFGRLEKMPLREGWTREDTEFTPWLASEENIALLGETIGMELEVQQEEASVGPFRADILCRSTDSEELVIIENQLERTDHGHLGQTITYAAGLDAVTVIWVAARFTEEHRAAMDWLNRISHESFRFFGIEIELWRIGTSPPAPKFNIVSKPNDWSKTVKEAAGRREARTPTHKARLEFWTGFAAFLEERQAKFNPPKPRPRNWISWGVGRSGVGLVAVCNSDEVIVNVDVNSRDHDGWYMWLHDRREQIETELGFRLDWLERPDRKYSQLSVRLPIDTQNSENHTRAFEWMLRHMEALDRVFRQHVKDLPDDGDDDP